MIVSDIQPQYFPRLHYVARMLASDVFIIRDEVQFVRSHKYPDGTHGVSYQAHTPIRAPDRAHLLTVPVKKGSGLPIHRTGVSHDHPWARKHVKIIKNFYGASPNRRRLVPELEQLLACRFSTLADLNIATICWALGHVLGVKQRIPDDLCIDRMNERLGDERTTRLQRIILGSQCPDACGASSASERIVALCERVGADRYVGGRTALQAYLDTDLFRRHGIEVLIQDWTCPTYEQRFTAKTGFMADLSIIDLLMNAPADRVASLLGSG